MYPRVFFENISSENDKITTNCNSLTRNEPFDSPILDERGELQIKVLRVEW